jgi:hypothetical protein
MPAPALPANQAPADPAALFTAVSKEYEVINVFYARRQKIQDDIADLSQTHPYPLTKGKELLYQESQLTKKIRDSEEYAQQLNHTAMLTLLKSADVANAKAALQCSIDKVKLALNNLAEFENFLSVAARFVEFAAKLSAAAAGAPLGFLAVANLIKEIDDIINMTLAETLSQEELQKIINDVMKDCTQATG